MNKPFEDIDLPDAPCGLEGGEGTCSLPHTNPQGNRHAVPLPEDVPAPDGFRQGAPRNRRWVRKQKAECQDDCCVAHTQMYEKLASVEPPDTSKSSEGRA